MQNTMQLRFHQKYWKQLCSRRLKLLCEYFASKGTFDQKSLQKPQVVSKYIQTKSRNFVGYTEVQLRKSKIFAVRNIVYLENFQKFCSTYYITIRYIQKKWGIFVVGLGGALQITSRLVEILGCRTRNLKFQLRFRFDRRQEHSICKLRMYVSIIWKKESSKL